MDIKKNNLYFSQEQIFILVLFCITLFLNASVQANSFEQSLANLNERTKIVSENFSKYLQQIEERIEIKTTGIYRHTNNIEQLQDLFFGLTELHYLGENNEIEFGISYQNTPSNNLSINNLSYKKEYDYFDYQIGKFISKIGVMDFLSAIDVLNSTRIEHYNDQNPNIRYIPSWMAKIDIYPDENSTLNLYIKPYSSSNSALFNTSVQFGLNAVPFLIAGASNNDSIELISKQVLLPIYKSDVKPAAFKYLNSKKPNEDIGIDNTSVFLNYSVTKSKHTLGALYTNAYSSFPVITFDAALISAVNTAVDTKGKNIYILDYLAKKNNEPIKSIKHFRYNQVSFYYESFIRQLGYRGEISYRDKFSLINKTSSRLTLSLGVDHQSSFYNNIEFQYSKFDKDIQSIYQVIWLSQSEIINTKAWKLRGQNILTYAVYGKDDVLINYLGIQFLYEKLEITVEYLIHSEQNISPQSYGIKVKVVF